MYIEGVEEQGTCERTTASHFFAKVSGSTGSMWVFFPLYSQLCPPKVSSSTSHGSTSNLTPAGIHIIIVSETRHSMSTATEVPDQALFLWEVQGLPDCLNSAAQELAS